jgi:hypothetical protein
MFAQSRFVSRVIGAGAVLSLMLLISGTKAHAQSVTITNFSYTGYPGGYDDVTDTINLGASFNNIPSNGGYGYGIIANVWYYSGPYASGTLLQSGSRTVYNNGGPLSAGNSTISPTVNVNTPALLRASEPAGTQSILYVYSVQVGGGCNGWSGTATAGGPTAFVVRG